MLHDETVPPRPEFDARPRCPLVGPDRPCEDIDHPEVTLDCRRLGFVDSRHLHGRSEIRRRRQHDPVLAERGDDVFDVAQERRGRTDEEDRAGQAGPLGEQQVRGAVEGHGRLSGSRRPLDDRDAGTGTADHDVLHPSRPRRVEGRQQCALADE